MSRATPYGSGGLFILAAIRHSFATYLLEGGYDIRTVQELLVHEDVKTAMVCTHVLNRGPAGVHGPIDGI